MQANNFTGYDAVYLKKDGSLYGIRTRVAAVKGRCPRPLDEQTTKEDCDENYNCLWYLPNPLFFKYPVFRKKNELVE